MPALRPRRRRRGTHAPVVTKLIDTSTCIGCKACEVACQEWNDLPPETTVQMGTYQTLPDMSANFWNLIKFREHEENGALQWLMRKDQCMHCADPGCLAACPAPGAIVQYTNGIVDFQQDQCIGCGYCITGCPFDVPKFTRRTQARLQVHAVRGPCRRRPAARLREGVSDQLPAVRDEGRDARRSPPSGSRSCRRTGSRTRPSTIRPASAARRW